MLECLVTLLVFALVVAVVIWIIETAIGAIATPPPAVFMILRAVGALLVLLRALPCLGIHAP
jgi:hypothetical protein